MTLYALTFGQYHEDLWIDAIDVPDLDAAIEYAKRKLSDQADKQPSQRAYEVTIWCGGEQVEAFVDDSLRPPDRLHRKGEPSAIVYDRGHRVP